MDQGANCKLKGAWTNRELEAVFKLMSRSHYIIQTVTLSEITAKYDINTKSIDRAVGPVILCLVSLFFVLMAKI